MARNESAIGDVVKRVVGRLETEKNFSREEIDACWKGLAGKAAFGHSRPTSLRKKILTIRVDSSGWLQELVLKKRIFLKGLKKGLGKDKIAEIRFRIGELNAEGCEQKTKEK